MSGIFKEDPSDVYKKDFDDYKTALSKVYATTAPKIAIVGSAQPSRNEAPYGDPSWEIFGLGFSGWFMPRCDQIFELHPQKDDLANFPDEAIKLFHGAVERQKASVIWLQESDIITYPNPKAKAFPYKEIASQFPFESYCSSFDWMIATAILRQPSEISLFGFSMESGTEYAYQRPSAQLWLGYAMGKGIKVTIHGDTNLCKTPFMFGTEPDTTRNQERKTFIDYRVEALTLELNKWEREKQFSESNITECLVRLDEMKWLKDNHTVD